MSGEGRQGTCILRHPWDGRMCFLSCGLGGAGSAWAAQGCLRYHSPQGSLGAGAPG